MIATKHVQLSLGICRSIREYGLSSIVRTEWLVVCLEWSELWCLKTQPYKIVVFRGPAINEPSSVRPASPGEVR